jgi:glyoxylase-like metal-dependent hydrolase (beta-lactamase superfamily II)
MASQQIKSVYQSQTAACAKSIHTCLTSLVAVFAASWSMTVIGQVDFDSAAIHVWHVQGNVYMLVGPVGNSTVQIGDDGVLVVDTQYAQLSDKILDAIAGITDKPVHYVLNTHAHPDHVGGNAPISLAGVTVAGGNVSGTIADAGEGAAILAHENVLTAMAAMDPAPPFDAWPTDTFFNAQKDLYFNGEAVQMLHQPNAHTNGDVLVHFRASDVISAGDIFVTTTYPFIDEASGGSINGIIAGLNRIIQIAVPAEKQEGGTMIVPGHGRVCDEADVVEYRDMLTIIRDRIQAMIDAGMTLRQVKASRPTLDYDGRYGADTGFWTTEQFVETVYTNLAGSTD